MLFDAVGSSSCPHIHRPNRGGQGSHDCGRVGLTFAGIDARVEWPQEALAERGDPGYELDASKWTRLVDGVPDKRRLDALRISRPIGTAGSPCGWSTACPSALRDHGMTLVASARSKMPRPPSRGPAC